MKCPICGAEMKDENYFGKLVDQQPFKTIREIWLCPNGDKENGSCASEKFRWPGYYYIHKGDNNLHEGYPK